MSRCEISKKFVLKRHRDAHPRMFDEDGRWWICYDNDRAILMDGETECDAWRRSAEYIKKYEEVQDNEQ